MTVLQKTYAESPVTLMCINRLLLNIILTIASTRRLPARLLVILVAMYWLAGLMNIIPIDSLFTCTINKMTL